MWGLQHVGAAACGVVVHRGCGVWELPNVGLQIVGIAKCGGY